MDASRRVRAVVTGAASGLEAACAQRLRNEGIDVSGADVAEGAEIRLDVGDESAIQRFATEAGEVDILVNSAGIIGPGSDLTNTALHGRRIHHRPLMVRHRPLNR